MNAELNIKPWLDAILPIAHTSGRRESRLRMRLYTVPEGRKPAVDGLAPVAVKCYHERDEHHKLPWGFNPKKPKGISSRQWKKAYKAMRRVSA